ncbi:uncharacterized protein LOC135690565 [Rhopilema esculentum]|uniref:uncharacterized protein LOC135690565 n=1 Tax=Rhopilema esculentum TaxID=499914 RepID=UPI0031D53B11
MDSKEDLDELTESFAKDLRAATPINPIDPLQPNITYRDPSIGGYHSRCSSALSDIHGFSFDTYSSEAYEINDVLFKSRDSKRRTTTPTKGFLAATSYGKNPMNVDHHQSFVRRAISQLGTQQRLQPSSQQRRHEEEKNSIDKVKSMKRLAQVVPHRIDMLYYMSGRSANMSQRYQLTDLEKARIQEASYRKTRSSALCKRHANSSASSQLSGNRHLRAAGVDFRTNFSRPNSPVRKRLGGPGDQNKTREDRGTNTSNEETQLGEKKEALKTKPIDRSRKLTIRSSYDMQTVDDPLRLESLGFDINEDDASAMSIVSKRQRLAFEAIFDDIDFDSNGKVTFNELVRGLFANISKKDARSLMQVFDVDKNKIIDRREFVAICALNDRLCGIRTESKYDCLRLDLHNLIKHLQAYRALFEMLDQDSDEKIHIDEVMLIMATAMGRDVGTNETIARTVMKSLDTDDKGFIDFVNFLTFIPFFLKLHNTMMNQEELKLGEIRETKENIRDQLRHKTISST